MSKTSTATIVASFARKATCHHCNGHGAVYIFSGSALREYREEKKVSMRSVATQANVSAAYLSDLELCRRNLSESRCRQLVEIINRLA